MKTTGKLTAVAAFLFFVISCKTNTNNKMLAVNSNTSTTTNTITMEDYTLAGASIMTFGPGNVLFVGDSRYSVVYALPTEATELKDPVSYNYRSIDKKIAAKLGVNPSDVVVQDMKIHPVSQEAYISVKRGHAPDAKSVIAILNPKNESVSFFNVAKAKYSKVNLKAPVTDIPNFWRDIPANTLTITDMDFHKGNLYVSGLTNGEFASTLRIIPYPFTGNQTKVGSIEMYHAVHTQNETRAPIRAMLFEELDGKETLIASYTCTPLVTFPASEIKEDNHIKAKTIAELGYGNVPIDMLTFTAQEQDGSYDKKLLITNKYRSGSLISLKDLAKANKGKGLSGYTQGPEGVEIFPVPLSGVMHIDDQNQMMVAILRRNIETGNVDLLSELKGSYFRLSDFVNEYDFADYEYTEEGTNAKNFHNMVKQLEGFPELVEKN